MRNKNISKKYNENFLKNDVDLYQTGEVPMKKLSVEYGVLEVTIYKIDYRTPMS